MTDPSTGTILTVTLNAALDVTYQVPDLRPSHSHRVQRKLVRPGGKGINVARVLHSLGVPVVVGGLAGGPSGAQLRSELDALRLPHELTPIRDAARTTVTIVTAGPSADATVFNEPGPTVRDDEWHALLAQFDRQLSRCRLVVLAGSLPPGVPRDAYAQLVACAHAAGVPTVLDAEGDALRLALAAVPTVVKANAGEVLPAVDRTTPLAAVDALLAAGTATAIITAGADGMVAGSGAGRWQASVPERVIGNPTGAGDACTAAVAAGLLASRAWPEILRDALALSAAAVAATAAGEIDEITYYRIRAGAADSVRAVTTPN